MKASPAPGVPLEGWLGDVTLLPRLYAWLARGEWSGAVVVRSGDVERSVYFAEGRIQTATSNDPAEQLVEQLVAAGRIDEAEVRRAAEHVGTRRRDHSFARQLVRLNLLDAEDVARAERERVVGIAESVLALRTGEYRAVPGKAAGEALPPQLLEVPRLVATGILGRWEDSWALDTLGGERAVLDIVPEALPDYEATGADEAYDLAFLRVDGRRTVRDVVETSPLPPHAALRFLAATRLLDCIRVVGHDDGPAGRREGAASTRSQASPRSSERAAARASTRESDAAGIAAAAPAGESASGATPAARPVRRPDPAAGSPPAATGAEESGAPGWLWLLLAIVLIAAIGGFVMVGLSELGASSEREALDDPAVTAPADAGGS